MPRLPILPIADTYKGISALSWKEVESLLLITLDAADDLVHGALGTARLQVASDRLDIAAKIARGEPVSETDLDLLYLRRRAEIAESAPMPGTDT